LRCRSNHFSSRKIGAACAWLSCVIPFIAIVLGVNGLYIPATFYLGLLTCGSLVGIIAVVGLFVWSEDPWFFAVTGLAGNLFLLGMYYTGYIERSAFGR
jgi:hypothetical protein